MVGGALGAALGYERAEKKLKETSDTTKEQRAAVRANEMVKYGAVGAAVGGLTGAAIGNVAANRRKHYARENAFLDSEIQVADKAIVAKKNRITELENEVTRSKKKIDQLEEQHKKNVDISKDLEAEQKRLETAIASNTEELKRHEDAISYLNFSLESSKIEAAATEEERKEWVATSADLSARRTSLTDQFAALNGVNKDLASQSERITALQQALKGKKSG
jgi:chromosome segregation ATPase